MSNFSGSYQMADFHYICTIESNYNTMRRILLITAILMANVMTMSGAKKSVSNDSSYG